MGGTNPPFFLYPNEDSVAHRNLKFVWLRMTSQTNSSRSGSRQGQDHYKNNLKIYNKKLGYIK